MAAKAKLQKPAQYKVKPLKSLQPRMAPTKITWEGTLEEHISNTPAFDGGNGKAAMAFINGGKLHKMTIPHARVRVRGTRVDRQIDGADSVMINFADFENDRMGYGPGIWNLPGDKPVEVFQNTPLRYGSPEHVFYSLVLLAELGMPDGWEGWIVVSVPPGLYNRVADQTEAGFLRGGSYDRDGNPCEPDGWWHIRLSADGLKPRSYRFSRVIVMMEGADATYGAYRWNLDGVPVEFFGADGQDALGGRCKILSAGFGTFDTPLLVDGELVDDVIDFSSNPTGGIGVLLADPILGKIKDSVPNANLTIAHVDMMLRDYATGRNGECAPWSSEAATVLVGGKVLKMEPVFKHFIDRYASWVWQQIASSTNENIDVWPASGGGWLYMEGGVMQKCREHDINLLVPSNVKHLSKYQYFEIEVIGMLCFLAALVRENL